MIVRSTCCCLKGDHLHFPSRNTKYDSCLSGFSRTMNGGLIPPGHLVSLLTAGEPTDVRA